LADVLAHHLAEIDAVEVEPQLLGEDLGGHRLAGPARAREERADAQAARALGPETPRLVDMVAPADVRRRGAQYLELLGREHEALPPGPRLETLGQVVELRPRPHAARLPQPRAQILGPPGERQGLASRLADALRAQIEARHHRVELATEPGGRRAERLA